MASYAASSRKFCCPVCGMWLHTSRVQRGHEEVSSVLQEEKNEDDTTSGGPDETINEVAFREVGIHHCSICPSSSHLCTDVASHLNRSKEYASLSSFLSEIDNEASFEKRLRCSPHMAANRARTMTMFPSITSCAPLE
eukprot:scaffold16330_cov171-Skeletonema_menzelii.AAC.7